MAANRRPAAPNPVSGLSHRRRVRQAARRSPANITCASDFVKARSASVNLDDCLLEPLLLQREQQMIPPEQYKVQAVPELRRR